MATKHTYLDLDTELQLAAHIQRGLHEQELIDAGTPSKYAPIIMLRKERAVEKLTQNYIRVVYQLSHKYQRTHRTKIPLEDIIQYGMTGLMRAIYKYDPERGCKFGTMAYAWINQAITRSCGDTEHMVRIPENVRVKMGKVHLINSMLDEDTPREEREQIISEETGITHDRITAAKNCMEETFSLNAPTVSDSSDTELLDIVFDAQESNEDSYIKKETYSALMKALRELEPTEFKIISQEYSLGSNSTTKRELLKELQISPYRYGVIRNKAVSKVRDYLTGAGYTHYDFH